MPEHTSWITYFLHLFPGLEHNTYALGQMALSKEPVGLNRAEASFTALLIFALIFVLALAVRSSVTQGEAIVPEERLSLRTFFEIFVGYFYGLAKEVMGAKRANRYFPIIGTCALFIFFSNALGLIPGLAPPTSSLNVTLGSGLLVFLYFNYHGIKENGLGYFQHLFGPWLGPFGIPINLLIFVVEIFSICVRPLTLALRLMLNMAVDHLIAGIFLGLIALFVPLPPILLGIIVIVVQTIVFCLLTTIYIGLATEHEEHTVSGTVAVPHLKRKRTASQRLQKRLEAASTGIRSSPLTPALFPLKGPRELDGSSYPLFAARFPKGEGWELRNGYSDSCAFIRTLSFCLSFGPYI